MTSEAILIMCKPQAEAEFGGAAFLMKKGRAAKAPKARR